MTDVSAIDPDRLICPSGLGFDLFTAWRGASRDTRLQDFFDRLSDHIDDDTRPVWYRPAFGDTGMRGAVGYGEPVAPLSPLLLCHDLAYMRSGDVLEAARDSGLLEPTTGLARLFSGDRAAKFVALLASREDMGPGLEDGQIAPWNELAGAPPRPKAPRISKALWKAAL